MLEAVDVKGVPEFTGVSEAGSDGLALRVKELMAHLEHKWLLSGKKNRDVSFGERESQETNNKNNENYL